MIYKKRSKTNILVIGSILAAVILTACSSSNKTTTEDIKNVKWDIGNNVGEKWKDGQNQFLTYALMAESEKGYYYKNMDSLGSFSLLYFFDKESGKSTVVCD